MGGGESVRGDADWTLPEEWIFSGYPARRPGKISVSKYNNHRVLWVDEHEVEFGEWYDLELYEFGSFSPGLRSAVCRGKPYSHLTGNNPILIGAVGRCGHDVMVSHAVRLLDHARVTEGWIKAVMPIVLGSPHVDAMTKMRLAAKFPQAGS